MPSRSFFGYAKPAFRYELLSTTLPQPIAVPAAETVTLLLPREMGITSSEIIKIGAKVKTGQPLTWDGQPGPAVVSTVTGTIEKVAAFTGDYNKKFTAITIAPDGNEELDDQFQKASDSITSQVLCDFLSSAPGGGQLEKLLDGDKPIDTIIIYGGDTDLLVETNLYILKGQTNAVNQGIKALKAASGIEKVVVVVPAESFQNFDGHFAADVKAVPAAYPGAQPLMILYHLTGQLLSQGQSFEDLGMLFIRAEAVASIGKAVESGRIPTDKILTVVDQNGNKNLVSAPLGTTVGSVLRKLNIDVNDGDRIIFGGPMTGTAIYSEDQPIAPDSDAIMVQNHADIVFSSDYPCINCGECTRICPSNIQVHMLERFLEVGQFQEGADLYDLYSCVECGLCSLVCPSRIPILQYIKLAKYELASAIPAEEENE
jgi:electron transport complex protein RnfC